VQPRELRVAEADGEDVRLVDRLHRPILRGTSLLQGHFVSALHRTTSYDDGRTMTGVVVADLVIDHLREHGRDVGPPLLQRDMAERK
jgi:hypothetical protein